ncbi:MAG: LysM peptidoglycan-binding domain-containing protein [Proteobacteria bacterium]|nr:LysM peptidoglycan-binding domain-containing protein [Pseudomonadota bacterium]
MHRIPVLALAILILSGCISSAYDDEDAINQRRSYARDEQLTMLPSPQKASEEAGQLQAEEQGREPSLRHVVEESSQLGDDDRGLSDMVAAYSEILVPEAAPQQPNFAPVKLNKAEAKGRRKPIFLGKLGFEAMEMQARGAIPEANLGRRTPAMAMAAKPSPDLKLEDMGSYVVKPGDSLSNISVAIYGVSNRWMELAHLNRLGDGSIIFPKEIILYRLGKVRK